LVRGDNLFTMNGPEWERSCAIFNSGLSASYICSRQPIIEKPKIHVETPQEYTSKGDMFLFDDVACRYIMDMIAP
jgi:hypothetical protein